MVFDSPALWCSFECREINTHWVSHWLLGPMKPNLTMLNKNAVFLPVFGTLINIVGPNQTSTSFFCSLSLMLFPL
jgi:hypothetical protein